MWDAGGAFFVKESVKKEPEAGEGEGVEPAVGVLGVEEPEETEEEREVGVLSPDVALSSEEIEESDSECVRAPRFTVEIAEVRSEAVLRFAEDAPCNPLRVGFSRSFRRFIKNTEYFETRWRMNFALRPFACVKDLLLI
jgi:hypothetical protein